MTKDNPNNTQNSSTDIYVGVALELNKQKIVLAPKTPVNKIKEKGLELELPDYVPLGQVGKMANELVKNFIPEGSTKVEEDNLKTDIPAIDNLINNVKTANITLGKFHVKIPPQTDAPTKGPTQYTVALAATWDEKKDGLKENQEEFGGFNMKVTGIFLMFTNEVQENIDQGKAIEEAAARIQQLFKSSSPEALKPATEQPALAPGNENTENTVKQDNVKSN